MLKKRSNYLFSDNKTRIVAKNCKLMYDWLSVTSNYLDNGVSFDDVMENVFVVSEYKNYINDSLWLNGYVQNTATDKSLWISASRCGRLNIKLCPPKFIKGNNVEEASLKDTCNVFEMLSHMVGYDLRNASLVTSVDITHTAVTDFNSTVYYPYLCHQKGEERWRLNSTLYYGEKKSRQKKFYDKQRDVKKVGGRQRVPLEFQGKNLTRFEVTLGTKGQLRNVLGTDVLLGHLFTDEYVEKLHNYWVAEYNAIPKNKEYSLNIEMGMKQKDVQKEIIYRALAEYGRLNIENDIEMTAIMADLSPSAKSRTKKALLAPFVDDRATKHDLIEELDNKILGFEPLWE